MAGEVAYNEKPSREIKSKHYLQIFFYFRQFRCRQYHQYFRGNPPVVDTSYLVQHDFGIRLQPIPGTDPKSQRGRVINQPTGERDDRCAWVVRVIQKIALSDQTWPYLAGFRTLSGQFRGHNTELFYRHFYPGLSW